MDIQLKNVDKDNWEFIRTLRNDNYQFFYKQKKPISKNEHFEYMQKQQTNSNFHHWLITTQEQIVGYVRILDNDVGIMIKEEFQNKGFALKALILVEEEAKKIGLSKLIALVQPENISSEKLFQKSNYKLKMKWYEKNIT